MSGSVCRLRAIGLLWWPETGDKNSAALTFRPWVSLVLKLGGPPCRVPSFYTSL